MVTKIGINGFGRIGRIVFRTCFAKSNIEILAINDPTIDIEYICYLIKFDSIHGKFNEVLSYSGNEITIKDVKIKVFHEKLPSGIPWYSVGVHYVIEASGIFTTMDKASGHLFSKSVKRVIVTAPSVDIPMIILGVNEEEITKEQRVVSCSSSTLYCLAPIVKILESSYGISEGFVTCIHAMTPSLKPLDGLCLRGRHWRDHRSVNQNIIPAHSGACKALAKIIPQVKGKICGLAFRVPIVDVSVLDITIRLNKDTNLHEIAERIEKASITRMKNVINTSYDETVSSDFMKDKHSCVLDVRSSLELTNRSFKLVCWYENEYSYACRVIDTILFSEEQFKYYKTSNTSFEATKAEWSQSIASVYKDKNILHNFNYDQNFINFNMQLGLKEQLNMIEVPFDKQIRSFKTNNENVVNRMFHDIQKNAVCTRDKVCQTDAKFNKKSNNSLSRLNHIGNEVERIKSEVDNALNKMNNEIIRKDKLHEVEFEENENYTPHNTQSKKRIKSATFKTNKSLTHTSSPSSDKIDLKEERSCRQSVNETEREPSTFDKHITELAEDVKNFEVLRKNDSLVFDVDTMGNLSFHNFGCTVVTNINNENNLEKLVDDNNYSCKSNTINYISNCNKGICNTAIIDDSNILEKQETPNQIHKKRNMSCIMKKTSKDITLSMFGKASDSYRLTNEAVTNNALYDKLDSGTDSDTSIQMYETKSQVIDITDLTNSTEDLARLDKICRIIEISDELSDKLFSALELKEESSKSIWSFKDLCEKIELDDFCNKVFGQSL